MSALEVPGARLYYETHGSGPLLTNHPSVVRTLVPFEPPAMKYLPDGQKWVDFFAETYDVYRESGVDWFEHEPRQYPAVELDLDALKVQADRIVLATGREGSGYPAHDVVAELGRALGRNVIELPGGHVGCVAHPAEFARELNKGISA